jgi:tetratricopeptide (TPR) repeat protein
MKKKMYGKAVEDLSVLLSPVLASPPAPCPPFSSDGLTLSALLYSRGTAYDKLEMTNEAILDYTRVLEVDPDHVNACYARAAAYNRKGLFAEAIEDYSTALAKDRTKGLQVRERPRERETRTTGGNDAPAAPSSPLLASHRKGSFKVGVEEYMRSREAVVRERLDSVGVGPAASFATQTSYSLPTNSHPLPAAIAATKPASGASRDVYSPPHTVKQAPKGQSQTAYDVEGTVGFPVSSQFEASRRAHTARLESARAVSPGDISPSSDDDDTRDMAGQAAVTLGMKESERMRAGLASPPPPSQPSPPHLHTADMEQQQGTTRRLNAPSVSPPTTTSSMLPPATPAHVSAPTSSPLPTTTSTSTSTSASSAAAAEADVHHARGFACRRKGDFHGAIAEYSRAIELDPTHFKAYFNRGFAYDKLRNFTAAIADYSRALAIDPKNAYAYYNRGISYDRSGDFDFAIRDFTMAMQILPSNADFYHNRGFCFRKQGNFELAIGDYTKALELDANHFKAVYNRAFSYDKVRHTYTVAWLHVCVCVYVCVCLCRWGCWKMP